MVKFQLIDKLLVALFGLLLNQNRKIQGILQR